VKPSLLLALLLAAPSSAQERQVTKKVGSVTFESTRVPPGGLMVASCPARLIWNRVRDPGRATLSAFAPEAACVVSVSIRR
jgi:hypothetical protein